MSGNIQISEAEWQIMKVLWHKPGLSAAQVYNEISKENKWSDGTTRTYIRRLIDKEALRYEQDRTDSRVFYYYPAIEEKDALESESRSFLNRIVKGRTGVAIATLIKNSELTDDEITELETILKQRRGE